MEIKTLKTFWIDVELMFNKRALINRVNNCNRYRIIAETPVDLTMLPKCTRTLPKNVGDYYSVENFRILEKAGLV